MRVFLLECSGEVWEDIAKVIQVEMQAEIIYWSGGAGMRETMEPQFPKTYFQDVFSATKGEYPVGFIPSREYSIDLTTLKKMAHHEAIALRMMNRWDYNGKMFPYKERCAHYYKLLEVWMTLLSELKPDLIIGPTSPHQVYDYIAYAVAEYLKIPFLFFERTFLLDRIFPLSNIQEVSTVLYNVVHQTEHVPLWSTVLDVIENIRKDYDVGKPSYSDRNSKTTISVWRDYRNTILRFLKKQSYSGSTLMKRGGTLYRNGTAKGGYNLLKKMQMISQMRKRRQLYMAHAGGILPARKYVYLSLSFQPERTTSPNADYFVDQYLIINMLKATLPDEVMIYVKEHPRQFNANSRAHHLGTFRDEEFYAFLVREPRVHLLQMDIDPFEIIDRALAVATTTGTVGWEALVRGKPAYIFGKTWYSKCSGAYEIESLEDLKKAMESKGPEEGAVEKYASAIQYVCVEAYADEILMKYSDLSIEQNSLQIVNLIKKYIKEHDLCLPWTA